MTKLTFFAFVLAGLVGLSAGCSRSVEQPGSQLSGDGFPSNYLAKGNGRAVGIVKPLCAESEPCTSTLESHPMPEIWLEFSDDSSVGIERTAMRVDLPATAVETLRNYWTASLRHRDQVVINRAADANDFAQKSSDLFRAGNVTKTQLSEEMITSPNGTRRLSHGEISELIRFLTKGANDLAQTAVARN